MKQYGKGVTTTKKTLNIAVLGGDARQGYAAGRLRAAGCRVLCCGVPSAEPEQENWETAERICEAARAAEVLLGPLPLTKDGVSLSGAVGGELLIAELVENLTPRHTLIAGTLPPEVRRACEAKGAAAAALTDRDDFAWLNAVPTAEGAIAEAIRQSTGTLHGSECLVLGYGRCAKVLAKKLAGMNARVTVAARGGGARCAAEADGFPAWDLPDLPDRMTQFGYIWNTIPAPVLEEALLVQLPEDAVVIDLASAPGGTDFAAAARLGLRALLLPGLPGRCAPKAAGEIVARVCLSILREQESGEGNQCR
ncbi:MAG: dipicolinate synthase subunit DpsA [Oscillospiraceae bacterium]|jgi:dipicolinate synthase subunit A|nr:dipicolinate synthase subunit DpsA [Oscillospiraceae bacterium]